MSYFKKSIFFIILSIFISFSYAADKDFSITVDKETVSVGKQIKLELILEKDTTNLQMTVKDTFEILTSMFLIKAKLETFPDAEFSEFNSGMALDFTEIKQFQKILDSLYNTFNYNFGN